eukprot:3434797-Lingulodinium_polyedra.AAC.1
MDIWADAVRFVLKTDPEFHDEVISFAFVAPEALERNIEPFSRVEAVHLPVNRCSRNEVAVIVLCVWNYKGEI